METLDVRVAEDIMMFALFKEVRKPERRKKRKLNHGGGAHPAEVESDDSDSDGGLHDAPPRMPMSSNSGKLSSPQPARIETATHASPPATEASSR